MIDGVDMTRSLVGQVIACPATYGDHAMTARMEVTNVHEPTWGYWNAAEGGVEYRWAVSVAGDKLRADGRPGVKPGARRVLIEDVPPVDLLAWRAKAVERMAAQQAAHEKLLAAIDAAVRIRSEEGQPPQAQMGDRVYSPEVVPD